VISSTYLVNAYFIKMNLCIGFIFCQGSDITVKKTTYLSQSWLNLQLNNNTDPKHACTCTHRCTSYLREYTSSSESLSFTIGIELTLAVSGRYCSTRLGEVEEDQSAIHKQKQITERVFL
jgi:hypothetical protein